MDKSSDWDVGGSLCRGFAVVSHRPFLFVSPTAAPESFAGMSKTGGQRQGRKLCLPWGKCHPWSLKGTELGLAAVVTLALHSQLRPLRGHNSEAISQSLFLQTLPNNIAEVSV